MQDFAVLQENPNYLLLYKPAGMLSVFSRLGTQDPRPCLLQILRDQYGEIFPVHRLDAEVSGLILYARNANSHRILNQLFENQDLQKSYQALTECQDPSRSLNAFQEWQLWSSKIVRGKKRSFQAPHGKEAKTRVCILKQHSASLIEWNLQPLTGRTHQLRLELSAHGFPILGDTRYGSTISMQEAQIALIATEINFLESTNIQASEVFGVPQHFKLPDSYIQSWQQQFLDHSRYQLGIIN